MKLTFLRIDVNYKRFFFLCGIIDLLYVRFCEIGQFFLQEIADVEVQNFAMVTEREGPNCISLDFLIKVCKNDHKNSLKFSVGELC